MENINNQNIDDKNSPNTWLKELLQNQLTNVVTSKKLNFNDIKRISKFLTSSIFDETECSIWGGYITNANNVSKGTYINFYFNKKKIALHRLLYLNFIGDVLNTEYIKFICPNKGKCCNINHMKKHTYVNTDEHKDEIINIATLKNDNNVHIFCDEKNLTIDL